MKCKKCGSPRARFVVSRKSLWKGRSGAAQGKSEPRTDYRVKCPVCRAEYEDKPKGGVKAEVQETKA